MMKTRQGMVVGGHEYLVYRGAVSVDELRKKSALVEAPAVSCPALPQVREVWRAGMGGIFAMVFHVEEGRYASAVSASGARFHLSLENIRQWGWEIAPSLQDVPDLVELGWACDEARGEAARARTAEAKKPALWDIWSFGGRQVEIDQTDNLSTGVLARGRYLGEFNAVQVMDADFLAGRWTFVSGRERNGGIALAPPAAAKYRVPRVGEVWYFRSKHEGRWEGDGEVVEDFSGEGLAAVELKPSGRVYIYESEMLEGCWTLLSEAPTKPGLDGLYAFQRVTNERMKVASKPVTLRESVSSLASKGPRWTRDGFDRCRGPSHEKWLRFLAAVYEQARVTRSEGYRVTAEPKTTEAEVDAFFVTHSPERRAQVEENQRLYAEAAKIRLEASQRARDVEARAK